MTDFFTEVANLATALVALATAITGYPWHVSSAQSVKRKATADRG